MRLVQQQSIRPGAGLSPVSMDCVHSRSVQRFSWIRLGTCAAARKRRAVFGLARERSILFTGVEVVAPRGVQVQILSWAFNPSSDGFLFFAREASAKGITSMQIEAGSGIIAVVPIQMLLTVKLASAGLVI